MRPLRNHPLLLLNSEFSSHNTKVTAILFALAPADFAPLRPPMPAHACIQLHYRRLPAAIRLFVRLCRLTPAYGSRNAIGSWPIRVAIALLPAAIRALCRAIGVANTRSLSRYWRRQYALLSHCHYALLSRYCPKGNTRSLSRYWRRQYALLAQLLALPIRWAWRTKCAFALNGKGDNHYKTTFGTFHRIGAIYLCH